MLICYTKDTDLLYKLACILIATRLKTQELHPTHAAYILRL